MHRSRRHISLIALALLAACHRGKPADEAGERIEVPLRPLANLAAQRVVVTPAFSLVSGETLGWSAQVPRAREFLLALDSALYATLSERGLKSQWIYPADLVRAARGSPTYAVDPYALGVGQLRNPNVASGTKLGDPLATQLRRMVALQEEGRAVLIPVELRFEKDSKSGGGVAALRVALVDGRLSDVRWIGTVRSDPSPTFSPALLTTLAAHVADLIVAP